MKVRDRPSVLFVTGHLPYPPISGGRRREYELVRRLCDRIDFHVVVISKTPDEDAANASAFRPHCASLEVWPAVQPPPGYGFPRQPLLALRHWAPEATESVERSLEHGGIDVVHVEGFYLMQHVPERSSVPVLLVEQNVEYTIWHQRMRLSRGRRQRRRNLAEYAVTLQAEIEAWKRSSLCAAVTEEDLATMRAAVPELEVRLIPDGADHVSAFGEVGVPRSIPEKTEEPVVAFVANFGYVPNVDAALYLTERIMPRVAAKVPSVKLFLVGNAPPPAIRALESDSVTVTGRVPAVEPYLDAATVVVCPLREGGGVKVKVLEALTRGKAVVTTSVGAQGLSSKATDALIVRDDPRSFARAVTTLLTVETERRALEQAAGAFARTLPTWDVAAHALAQCYEELVARSGVNSASAP
ncbi:MAG TPA: glycosyltransferase family 4 protein [Actinomycetota bacterium]|nr:glycosyltransferase family 4 protein [Actinomycetota bacterium]